MLPPELGWAPAQRGGHAPNYGFLVNSEQELVSVTRSWTHAGHRIQGKGSREPDSTEPSYDESMFEAGNNNYGTVGFQNYK